MAYYDASLAPHAHNTLGLDALGTGLIYLAPSLVYACVNPFAGRVVRTFGARNPLAVGCLLPARKPTTELEGPDVFMNEVTSGLPSTLVEEISLARLEANVHRSLLGRGVRRVGPGAAARCS